jgi:Icc-related predicted phosphoesterase
MPTFQIVSDLHLEFEQNHGKIDFTLPITNADAVILAGDTARGTYGISWAKAESVRHGKPFIYLLGNHEFYGRSYEKVFSELNTAASSGPGEVHVLQNSVVTIQGVAIFGATLWTDFRLHNTPDFSRAVARDRQTGMNDFKKIRRNSGSSSFLPHDAIQEHTRTLEILAAQLSKNPNTLVVTHHAPSPDSLSSAYSKHNLAPAYASDLSEFIKRLQPKYWIHGHIHSVVNYYIGNTNIVSNPRGYINISQPEQTGFNANFTISL